MRLSSRLALSSAPLFSGRFFGPRESDSVTQDTDLSADLAADISADPSIVDFKFSSPAKRHPNDKDAGPREPFDEMTGLANLASATRQIDIWLEQARRAGDTVAVAMIGMEECHPVGRKIHSDANHGMQNAIAWRLYRLLDGTRLVARLDDCTFLIAARDLPAAADAGPFARDLGGLVGLPIVLHGHEIEAKPYLGVAVFPDDGINAATLIQRAEQALGARTLLAKPGIQFCTPALERHTLSASARNNRMLAAIADGSLGLHYQMQLNHHLRRYVACEAFLHCDDPMLGDTESVIAQIEETDNDFAIGASLLALACQQAIDWQHRGSTLSGIAVHFSTRQLFHPQFLNAVRMVLQDTNLAPENLDIELSQSTVLEDPTRAAMVLEGLSALGVGLILDEFNADPEIFTGLRYLPIDGVKLDKRLVSLCTRDANARDLISAIIAGAQDLNLSVTADGVETLEQHALLAELGCHLLQGPRFGRPAAAETISGPFSFPTRISFSSNGDRLAAVSCGGDD